VARLSAHLRTDVGAVRQGLSGGGRRPALAPHAGPGRGRGDGRRAARVAVAEAVGPKADTLVVWLAPARTGSLPRGAARGSAALLPAVPGRRSLRAGPGRQLPDPGPGQPRPGPGGGSPEMVGSGGRVVQQEDRGRKGPRRPAGHAPPDGGPGVPAVTPRSTAARPPVTGEPVSARIWTAALLTPLSPLL